MRSPPNAESRTIDGTDACDRWSGADDSIRLDDVRRALAKVRGTLAEEVRAGRAER